MNLVSWICGSCRTKWGTNRTYLTFWHWSSVTPYTSSYEFAGSCVFDKQSPGRLLLQPPSRETRWWENPIYKSQITNNTRNIQSPKYPNEDFSVWDFEIWICDLFVICKLWFGAFPITLRVMGAGLIPKLRPLFCRVPWRPLIRSPCSPRADYLCRFTVRFCRVFRQRRIRSFSRKTALFHLSVLRRTSSLFLWFAVKGILPDLPGSNLRSTNIKSNNVRNILIFVTSSERAKVMEY